MKLTQNFQWVRTPKDRYELAVSERRHIPVSQPNEESKQLYENKLDSLEALMLRAKFNWQLQGGLILPSITEKYLRHHGDVDIGIFKDQLPDAVDHFRNHNYAMFYMNPHISRLDMLPWDLMMNASLDDINQNQKRLHAVKVRYDGSVDEDAVLREIDVHVHEKKGNLVYTSKQHVPLPYTWFQPNFHSGLNLGDLRVLYFFKLGCQRPRHVFDRHLIENKRLLSPVEIKEVKNLREKCNFKSF